MPWYRDAPVPKRPGNESRERRDGCERKDAMNIIDRRLNPKSRSLGNRQRFIRRAKAQIREAVSQSIKGRKVSEVEGSEQIRIRTKNLKEPAFSYGNKQGQRDFVLPGNEQFRSGDEIQKPPGGGGGGGNEGSPDGEGDDDFVFALSKEEFLNIFFEDLELPNLAATKMKVEASSKPVRAGYSNDGPAARLNKVQTIKRSLARRVALARPKREEIEALEAELEKAQAEGRTKEAAHLREELAQLRTRFRTIAYIDPIDIRFNRFERVPKPTTQAVMICMMDASASMTEDLKDLAKRFFMLLHVFLSRHYREVDVVFIRHTSVAAEVDEETFFRSTDTGGTVVSTALEEMLRVVRERYPIDDWNIYAAQASDGHNFHDDMAGCLDLLENQVLPICRYFAYIEVGDGDLGFRRPISLVWRGYRKLRDRIEHFAMRRVNAPSQIYPVFHDLFAKTGKGG